MYIGFGVVGFAVLVMMGKSSSKSVCEDETDWKVEGGIRD
jgi:hypothetical protein